MLYAVVYIKVKSDIKIDVFCLRIMLGKFPIAGLSGRAVYGVGLRPLAC